MEQSVVKMDSRQDATCVGCSKTLMEHEWETDSGPEGEENIPFCPECGEQLTFTADSAGRAGR